MRKLYFDCFSGASGNMILGALIDAGVSVDALRGAIDGLGIPNVELVVEKVDRSGISSTHVEVRFEDEKAHRHLKDIVAIIDASSLSESVKDLSKRVFSRLAEAEGKVHGIDPGKVHFHEVGAVDAIVDIVGSCFGFEELGIEAFAASKLTVGSGTVTMAHGRFPVPPPAVVELLKGVPIAAGEQEGELLTPTGAAIISTVCNEYGQMPEMTLLLSGYGAGTRNPKGEPNVLRILIGETADVSASTRTEKLTLLETNIDDLSPQVLGFAMERAFALGALDCWFTAIQMKKDRPATLVSILTPRDKAESIKEMLFCETTTLGIRSTEVSRECLDREMSQVETEFGPVTIKTAKFNGRVVNRQPEFDELREISLRTGIPLKDVAARVLNASALKAHSAKK